MKHRFVSAKKPCDYADELHAVQREISKLKARMDELASTEKHLQNYLRRVSGGKSFLFNAPDGFQKIVKVSHHSRLILDQDKAKRMLKTKTPYTTSEWDSVKVDWVYE